MKFTQEQIVNHLKNSGFVFQGSEIYGGLANTWDYGFLGSLVKNNIKKIWIQKFVKEEDSFLLDSAIFMNPKVWEASGHLDNFQDPLIDCKGCKGRFREDHLIEKSKKPIDKTPCPTCGKTDWTDVRQFNLMFKTKQGVTDDSSSTVYLRPETAQGIFVNFKNIARTTRKKLPFGIGQIGKAFRNEITPGNFIFRTREFEQMELEYFVFPQEANSTFKYFLNKIDNFLINDIGLKSENIRQYSHPKEKLSHYSNGTTDFEYQFPFGWQELWGIANRTDFDLRTHMDKSGSDLTYLDESTNSKIIPFVIEPSVGVDRLFYAMMCDAMHIEKLEKDDERTVLKLKPALSPYQLAVLPLTNKQKDEAKALFDKLVKKMPNINLAYDYTGSIGKRYRRQDAIGTYLCLTVDFDTSSTSKVTIRNRDTMKQDTIEIKELEQYILNIIENDN